MEPTGSSNIRSWEWSRDFGLLADFTIRFETYPGVERFHLEEIMSGVDAIFNYGLL